MKIFNNSYDISESDLEGVFRHKLDISKKCSEADKKATKNWLKSLRRQYIDNRKFLYYRQSMKIENARDHIDWVIWKEGKIHNTVSIDMKAMKRAGGRHVSEPQAEYIWIEFQFEYENGDIKKGWLYGKQDLLAFEQEDHFLIVKRNDLEILSEKLVDLNQHTTNPVLAEYIGFNRKNTRKNEILSKIHRDDIIREIYHKKWYFT